MGKAMTRRSFAGLMVIAAGSAVAAASGCSPSSNGDGSAIGEGEVVGTSDLVVIGAGAAGLAGAAAAAQSGASVIVLEANSMTGGTTSISGGHYKFMDDDLLALLPERTEDSDAVLEAFLDYDPADFDDYGEALSTLQEQITEYLASDDTQEFDSLEYWLILHYLECTSSELDPDGVVVAPPYELIYPAYANQAEIKDWLVEGGFEYEAFGDNAESGGPFSVNPTGPSEQGAAYITILQGYAEDAGVEIVTKATATALLEEDGRITGVQTSGGDIYLANQGVLLAAGGFASSSELVAEEDVRWDVYAEGLSSCEPTTNDGTALEAAQAVGAATANLGFTQYQTFPASGVASIETTIPMCMAAKMVVNQEGVRFCDDSTRFATQSAMVSLGQTDNVYYMIGDSSGIETMGELYDSYLNTGDLTVGDTVEEAAEAAGLDGAAVAATVELYNSYVEAGSDPDFGREFSDSDSIVDGAPYTVMAMREYVQHTMGGVVIDATGHVVDEDGSAIEGLFAAGEVVGNLDGAQRRHGDNFAQILYYGCLAGRTVADAV